MHFKRLPTWLQIFCVLTVALVFVWGGWMALRDTLCTLRADELLLKRPIRGACFEFWLNRYQTLASAVVAAAIALVVVRPVFKQLRAMNIQTALNAKGIAEDLAELIENEIAAASAIETRFWFASSFLSDLNIHDLDALDERDTDAATKELEEIETYVPTVGRNSRRLVGDAEIQSARRQALDAITTHRRRLQSVIGRARVRSASAAAGNPPRITDRWRKVVKDAEQSKVTVEDALRDLLKALHAYSKHQWQIVRSYERHAQDIRI